MAVCAAIVALSAPALAGMPEQPSVTVLRGSSAPPPPEPAQQIVVLHQVVYQPFYSYTPGYAYPSFYGSAFLVRNFFPKFQPPARPVMPASLPNGWPLIGSLAPMRR